MDEACKFTAQFYSREKKNILNLKKTVELVPFIIVCTLVSVKFEVYQYYQWNKCVSSFLAMFSENIV